MPRSFVGLLLNDATRAVVGQLTEALPEVSRRFSTSDLHTTVTFLGEQSDAKLDQVAASLSELKLEMPELRCDRASVIQVEQGVLCFLEYDAESCAVLESLKSDVDRRLEDCGVRVQRKKYRPHITIGYIDAGSHTPKLLPQITVDITSLAVLTSIRVLGGGPYDARFANTAVRSARGG